MSLFFFHIEIIFTRLFFLFHCEAPNFRMEPVTALGVLSLILNIMCAALNLIRGIHLAEHSLQVTFSIQFKLKDT